MSLFLNISGFVGSFISSASLFSTTCKDFFLCLKTKFQHLVRMTQFVFFTFMLPCVVIDFLLNDQPDALIIPILFCYKTLHVSGIVSAHHQEFSTEHSALVRFMQVSDDRFQDARNMYSFITE